MGNTTMNVSEFVQHYPEFGFDFEMPIRNQPRIYDNAILDHLPVELIPDSPYSAGGRGRPNPNQTLTHSQCATCRRVLRNDFFYTLPSMMKKNVVYSHCRECSQSLNAGRYETRTELIRARRELLWRYLAPRCASCGFDGHPSAMDLHHPRHKETQIQELLTNVALTLDFGKIEALFREVAKCVPLCSNCHRLYHAGVIELPTMPRTPEFRIADLLTQLRTLE
jgi:hypothetical protein